MKTFRNGLLSSVALAMVLNAGAPIAASYAEETKTATDACQEVNRDDCPTDPAAAAEAVEDKSETEESAETEAGASVETEATAETESGSEELPAEATAETEADAAADAEVTAEGATEETPVEETAETGTDAAAETEATAEVEAEASSEAEATAETETGTEELPAEATAETETGTEELPAEATAETDAAADAEVTAETATETEATEQAAESEATPEAEATAEAETGTEELPAEATAETDAAADAEVTAETATETEATTEAEATAETGTETDPTGETTAANEQVDEDTLKAVTTPEQVEKAQQESAEKAVEEAARREARKSRDERQRDREERLKILGAVAAGAAIGAIIPQIGGRIVEQQGDRVIVQRGDTFIVLKDENERIRHGGADVEVIELEDGWTKTIVTRRNGVQVVTVRDEAGFIVERIRILPNGDEIVLIDNRDFADRPIAEFELNLPPLRIDIPRDEYIVEYDEADDEAIIAALTAPPVEEVERVYSLREVRESERLREKVRSIELDTITFATNSAEVSMNQASTLKRLGEAMNRVIENDPDEVFMVEGHTDAVGSDLYNLALSDRRAESVATLLTDLYEVPPENMVTQGYGEQYLKVPTLGPSRENRRVTVRRITPLIQTSQQTSQR